MSNFDLHLCTCGDEVEPFDDRYKYAIEAEQLRRELAEAKGIEEDLRDRWTRDLQRAEQAEAALETMKAQRNLAEAGSRARSEMLVRAKSNVESRSVQRRKAAQRGEPAPTFDPDDEQGICNDCGFRMFRKIPLTHDYRP